MRKQLPADDVSETWCVVQHSNKIFRAQIQHVGRGRFRILNDNQKRSHVGQIVDASDIINCEK
jgi:hypothetical protein